jgi:polyhydroxybutyrate depolymerase
MPRRGVRSGLAAGVLLLLAACSSHPASGPTAASPAGSSPTASSPTTASPARHAAASPGCRSATTPAATDRPGTIEVGGAARRYLLTTPAAHPDPEPLVVDFHGYGEGNHTESLTSQFGALGQRDGFLVVFPSGTGDPVAWDTSTGPGNPDIEFVKTLLTHLEATQCIDESRVYATGLSQGAFMTSTVACVLSDRFAAVAPVAGIQRPSHCPITRPVPILAFHGTADPILHFNGGIGRKVLASDLRARPRPLPKLPAPRLDGPGYPAHVKQWAALDGCKTSPTDTRLSPHVIHRVYPCPRRVAVQFDIILGGGHTWPGSALSKEIRLFVGHTTSEIDATTTIWSFFRRFQLATPTG